MVFDDLKFIKNWFVIFTDKIHLQRDVLRAKPQVGQHLNALADVWFVDFARISKPNRLMRLKTGFLGNGDNFARMIRPHVNAVRSRQGFRAKLRPLRW